MTNNENIIRTDPDTLLSAIAKKKKRKGGRLYLFIGMAPGVGKTYAMLLAAHDAKKNGVDVVIGVVETHGRKETESLLNGLEILPKKNLEHREIEFLEMDIDAILQRKPTLALVDELAHNNVPGSRHVKRWQDVFELLDNGIDVYSTLNVQHLESRKDAVEEIAKITISETVPDSVLDRAFQIQLIDLSVPDLLRRLKEGKVYLGDKAEFAAANFFKEEKLTALREIALRVAAERVDAELQSFATEREAGTFWPATERLMVAVGFSTQSEKIIRAARRMAYNIDATWIAVHVSTNELVSDKEKSTLAKDLELARNLGAEVITATDINVVDALIRIARQKDITQLIVGRSTSSIRRFFGRRSIIDQLITKSSINVSVLGQKPDKTAKIFARLGILKVRSTIVSFFNAFAFTCVLIAVNALIVPVIGYRAVGFLFLLGILILGLFVSIGPILCAAVITMGAWNFFFIPPVGAFHINNHEDIFLCISYLVAALATGILTRRSRYQQEILLERETRSETLRRILLDIATEPTIKATLSSVMTRVVNFLHGDCDVALLKKDRSFTPFMEQRLTLSNINREMAVAKWAVDNDKVAGRFTETLSSADALYIPLKGSFDTVGVLAYQTKKSHTLSVEDMDFLFTVARQLATSLERDNFRKRALEAERLSESEKLHQTLLQLLVAEAKSWMFQRKGEEKFYFIMDNFLVASRLSMGIFPLKKVPCDLRQVLDEAINKIEYAIADIPINIRSENNLPKVSLEKDLFVHALANVLLNSAQHSPTGKEILIEVTPFKVGILDQGPGVKEEDLGRIFDKFYRIESDKESGYGLGLAIAKGVIKAHEGKIFAVNRSSGGLKIVISLPSE